MDFSERTPGPFVTLGHGSPKRRHAMHEDGGESRVERFLGARLHGFTTIVHVERGSGVIAGEFGRVAIEAGDIVAVPPGLVAYSFRGSRRVSTLAVPRTIPSGVVVRAADLPLGIFERGDGALVDVLAAAPRRVTLPRSAYERTAMQALACVDRLPSNARLSRIAHDLGYTSDGLAALLRRYTGHGFAAWRDALLLAHVRSLVGAGASVVTAARGLGVESSYVHRRFARAHGTTPGRWRASPTLPRHALAHEWDALLRHFVAAEAGL